MAGDGHRLSTNRFLVLGPASLTMEVVVQRCALYEAFLRRGNRRVVVLLDGMFSRTCMLRIGAIVAQTDSFIGLCLSK